MVTRFSPRPGTPAADMGRRVPGWVSKERSRRLTDIRFAILEGRLAELMGAEFRALATEGIQRGHMSLHAKNVVVMAAEKKGIKATPEMIDKIVPILVQEKKVRMDRAEELIREMQ